MHLRTAFLAILGALGLLLLLSPGHCHGAPPNFVVILTDDQRWDTLWAMPHVHEHLVTPGVQFTRAFVTTPLCCPSRASWLSGGFLPHNTGVLTNGAPNGGVGRFLDTATLPVRLQQAGYATALIGKYLNHYDAVAAMVPPGWTRFVTTLNQPLNQPWTAYTAVAGSSQTVATPGTRSTQTQYVTDFQRDTALAFLDSVGTQPFFLYIVPNAPHGPATPAPQDAALFPTYRYRKRAWNEADRSDKTRYVQQRPPLNIAVADTFHRQQLRSLQAVDRAAAALMVKLSAMGVLSNTVVIYTSDNGYQWGEHGLAGKSWPYDESLRVPLIIRAPGIAPRIDTALVAANLDVPAMIAALAGVSHASDGLNLHALLTDPTRSVHWREGIIAQFYPHPGQELNWSAWRGKRYTYTRHATGEEELYDLVTDPYQLQNIATLPTSQAIITPLAAKLDAARGLSMITWALPPGQTGVLYSTMLTAWGGTLPYVWTLVSGTLPSGVTLTPAGSLAGIPTQTGAWPVQVQVTSQAMATQRWELQRYVQLLTLTIVP